MSVSLLSAAGK